MCGRRKVVLNERLQLIAEPRCALRTESFIELRLRLSPRLVRSAQPLGTHFGELKLLAAAVQSAVFDADETVALQWQHGSAESRAIHHQLAGKRVDGHRPEPLQLRQDRKLRRA